MTKILVPLLMLWLVIPAGAQDLESARAARDAGNYIEAAELFNRYIGKHPDDAQAYADLGDVYIHSNQNDAALKALLVAVKGNPDDAYSWCNLGIANVRLLHFDSAISNFMNCIRHDKDKHSGMADEAMNRIITYYTLHPAQEDAKQNIEESLMLYKIATGHAYGKAN